VNTSFIVIGLSDFKTEEDSGHFRACAIKYLTKNARNVSAVLAGFLFIRHTKLIPTK